LNISEVSITLRISDTDLWIMTDHGLFRYDGSRLTPYTINYGLLDNSIDGLALAPDGTVWAVSKHGLARFDGTEWHSYKFPGSIPEGIGKVKVDQNNTVWVTTLSGMYSFNGEDWRLYTIKDGLANNLCGGIAFDSDGGLWVSTISGLSRISP
jgi:ligand-binding sensor domain-containing protein